jgi:curved DNA-binding protein
MDFKDYYKVLGVDRAANQKAISAAYRKLARRLHPDVNKAPGAEDKFKEINEAYQVLGDAERRARYDQMYQAYQRGDLDWQQMVDRGATQTPGGWTVTYGGDAAGLEDLLGGLGGFSDFFKQFFGADVVGQRPGAARGGAGRRRANAVNIEDLLRQSAQSASPPQAEAPIAVTLEEALAGAQKSVGIQLNGTTRRFDVTIPKGVRGGQKIRLPGALDGGDLYLTVEIQPHPYFERREDDLIIEIPVTPSEAVLGATIEVPTLEGKVEMTIPAGTQNGQTFRLRGQGMPRRDGGRGDQLVRVKVVLPPDPSPRERQLYEELAKLRSDNPRAHLGRK